MVPCGDDFRFRFRTSGLGIVGRNATQKATASVTVQPIRKKQLEPTSQRYSRSRFMHSYLDFFRTANAALFAWADSLVWAEKREDSPSPAVIPRLRPLILG